MLYLHGITVQQLGSNSELTDFNSRINKEWEIWMLKSEINQPSHFKFKKALLVFSELMKI